MSEKKQTRRYKSKNDDKRRAGKDLYLAGFTQTHISKLFRVTEKTISKWAIEDDWQGKLIQMELFKDDSLMLVRELILYQLRVLKKRKDAWLEEDEPKLIERGDIDAIQKLFTTIRGDEKKWSDYVTVIKELTNWIADDDLELAQTLTQKFDRFLNEKRKVFKT